MQILTYKSEAYLKLRTQRGQIFAVYFAYVELPKTQSHFENFTYRKWLTVKLLALMFLSLSVFAGNKILCEKLFNFTPIQDIKKDGKILGEGQNAVVRVFTDANGEKYVVKTYKSDSAHRNSQIQNDLRVFKFLNAHKKNFSFILPDVSHLGGNKMKLSYHPGRTVLDLLNDKETKPEIKKKIETSYKKMMNEVEATLHDFHGIEKSADVLSAENDSLAMGDVHIIIKKDNVIVDPETLKLTLIDPH